MEAVVSSCAHIEASMVPISVSLTDPNPDASDPNIDVFRDDNWFVADVQRTGKYRHRQKRNKKKGKHSSLHDVLLDETLALPIPRRMRAWFAEVCIELTSSVLEMVLEERGSATRLSEQAWRCPPDPKRRTRSIM
jgi:hypothetical protein